MVATIIILVILLIIAVIFEAVAPALMAIVLVTMEEHKRDYFDRIKNMLKKGAPKVYEIIDKAMVDNFPTEEVEKRLKKFEE